MQSFLYKSLALMLSIVLSFSGATLAQSSTPQGVLSLVELKYGVDTDTMQICGTYMIDGLPFAGLALEQELMKHAEGSLGMVDFLEPAPEAAQTNCQWVIWISTKDNQTETEKERLLAQIATYYNASVPRLGMAGAGCQLCKVFMINDIAYPAEKVAGILQGLKSSDISYIAWYSRPVNTALYGSAAKNGLIEIRLHALQVQGSKKR